MLFKHTWSPIVSSRVSSFETGALMEHFLEGSTPLIVEGIETNEKNKKFLMS